MFPLIPGVLPTQPADQSGISGVSMSRTVNLLPDPQLLFFLRFSILCTCNNGEKPTNSSQIDLDFPAVPPL